MVSAKGIARPLRPLTAAEAGALPGQLGVYEILNQDGTTMVIAIAGALEPFGLRSAVLAQVEKHPHGRFRYECTHAYMTRWQELLMLHDADHGCLPAGNLDDEHRIGTLS